MRMLQNPFWVSSFDRMQEKLFLLHFFFLLAAFMQKMHNHFLIFQKFLENQFKKFGKYGK